MTQENQAGHSLVARIRVGEMTPNVSKSSGTEERIRKGMEENISVRMSLQPQMIRELDAAKDEFPARDQPVDVIAKTDTHCHLFAVNGLQNVCTFPKAIPRPGEGSLPVLNGVQPSRL